ncbi:hypothetical protein [Methylobacterium sp. J-070]|nr:hypothetical protein [Methylobacterium sp. J-070]MCJ2054449.1 hypothetical protein [Methylobacterium sp. J-070]
MRWQSRPYVLVPNRPAASQAAPGLGVVAVGGANGQLASIPASEHRPL